MRVQNQLAKIAVPVTPISSQYMYKLKRLPVPSPMGNPNNLGHLKETGNGSQRSDLDVDDYSVPGTEIANITQ